MKRQSIATIAMIPATLVALGSTAKSDKFTPDAASPADCGHVCHLAVKSKDYVFHPYSSVKSVDEASSITSNAVGCW